MSKNNPLFDEEAEDEENQIDCIKDHQQSFYKNVTEDDDIKPQELSGDENAQKSLMLSSVTSANKSNFLLTVTTIMKTVIGAGILSLPFTVKGLGYVLAIIVFVVVAGLTHFASILLLNAKNLSRHSNFSTILYHLHQNKFAKGAGSILILLNNMGICILELTIFKEAIRKLIEDISDHDHQLLDQFYTSTIMIVVFVALIELPLTLFKKIENLKIYAFFGVSGILVFIGCFVVHYFIEMGERDWAVFQMRMFPEDWFKAAAVIPNLLLALSYQMNFFPVFKGMKDASDRKMNWASFAGVGGCATAYLLVGLLGYSLYGNNDNFGANFLLQIGYADSQRVLFYGMNIGFLISILFSFPVMFFGARNNFIALMKIITLKQSQIKNDKWRENSDNVQQISSYIQSQDKFERRRKANLYFLVYTLILFLIIIATAIVVDDIEAVINLIGAVCSTSIGVILPNYFYFALVDKKKKNKTLKYYFARVFFTIMIPYAIFSIVAKNLE